MTVMDLPPPSYSQVQGIGADQREVRATGRDVNRDIIIRLFCVYLLGVVLLINWLVLYSDQI